VTRPCWQAPPSPQVVTVLFIAWWNWRLYVWLSEGGISDRVAAVVVFGPFGVILIWLLWRSVPSNR
jgi:hypothetical protein